MRNFATVTRVTLWRFLAPAVIIVPPAGVGVAPEIPTDADPTVGLHIIRGQTLCVVDGSYTHCAFLRRYSRRLFLLGKHLGRFRSSDLILLKVGLWNVIEFYFVFLSRN